MTEPFLQNSDLYLHIDKWQRMNNRLKAGFTTRNHGNSQRPYDSFNLGLHVPDRKEDVLANRQKLAKDLSIGLESWVSGEQIHQTNVHIVTAEDKGKGATSYSSSLANIDGIVTNRSGLLCTAFFADCVPLYFFDPDTEYIGIAHAGWKGTVHRIGEKMVNTFKAAGTDPANLLVAIGPCISRDVYEVDKEVINHIPEHFHQETVVPLGNNHFLLDLKQLNKEILLQQGVLPHNIDITNYCTFRDEALFFSHRRDHGKTGRMLGYIGYTS